jgi:hypothetical protein
MESVQLIISKILRQRVKLLAKARREGKVMLTRSFSSEFQNF